MMKLQKELKDYTFDELVQMCQGDIVMSIPVGDFNYAVWRAMELVLRWKAEQEKK